MDTNNKDKCKKRKFEEIDAHHAKARKKPTNKIIDLVTDSEDEAIDEIVPNIRKTISDNSKTVVQKVDFLGIKTKLKFNGVDLIRVTNRTKSPSLLHYSIHSHNKKVLSKMKEIIDYKKNLNLHSTHSHNRSILLKTEEAIDSKIHLNYDECDREKHLTYEKNVTLEQPSTSDSDVCILDDSSYKGNTKSVTELIILDDSPLKINKSIDNARNIQKNASRKINIDDISADVKDSDKQLIKEKDENFMAVSNSNESEIRIDIGSDIDTLNIVGQSTTALIQKKLKPSKSKCNNDNIFAHAISKHEEIETKSNAELSKDNESPKTHMSKNTSNVEPKKISLKIKSPNSEELERSSIPVVINPSDQKVFKFFWLDAYEDSYAYPGVLFLFGKVFDSTLNQYISCCVTIKNIPRRIYVLPRGDKIGGHTRIHDAYNEFREYAHKKNINVFRSKEVQKAYVFENQDVSQNTTYLEVRYSALCPALDSNYSGPAIQAIYGTSVTALELFLIEKNIRGPCWMDVKVSPINQNISSWCKINVHCATMQDISTTQFQQKPSDTPPDIPPFTVAALSIQVSSKVMQNSYDIASIGISIQKNFYLDKELPEPLFSHNCCLVAQCTPWLKNANQVFAKINEPKVILCETETNMLEQLLQHLRHWDPDFLVGYDTEFEYDILFRKIFSSGLQDWSQIGKLKRTNPPKFKEKIYFNQVLCGRPLCDIKTSMNEFQPQMINSDLASLYSTTFNKEISYYEKIEPEKCLEFFDSEYKIMCLVRSIMSKVSSIFEIMVELNILSLAVQVTSIVGNTLSRTLSRGAGEKNEFLLLHEFQSKNYLTPDKKTKDNNVIYDNRKKSSYAGGVILEPKAGFYDTLVLLLDFNSLYPSIIQEFNICFSTIPGTAYENVSDLYCAASCVEQGILPALISRLVQSRLQIKKMMDSENFSPALRRQFNSRQLALKLIANSIYGCLGSPYSRFYAKDLAALVTMRGREIFQQTKNLIQSFNYDVIYGDTDSFMISVGLADYEQVMAVGKQLQKEINKLFKKITIKIDQVFKYLILMKKKQYAGLTIKRLPNGDFEYKKDIKGLEIVRRDCCAIASETGNKVLDELLKGQPSKVRLKNVFEILEITSRELRDGKLPLSSLEITKTLSKDLDEYTNNNYPHLVVAKRLNKMTTRQWKAGDAISYIICEDNTARKPLERAYHIKELSTIRHIKIDVNYYLLYQIFPIILKICDPIEGIEDVSIAQSLGISDIYKPKHPKLKMPPSCQSDNNRQCISLHFKCLECNHQNEVKTSFIYTENGCQSALAKCSDSKCNSSPWKYPHVIKNNLQLIIRKCITDYYTRDRECSNPLCLKVYNHVDLDLSNDIEKCLECHDGNLYRKYTEIDLFNQFKFFLNIFTLDESTCKSSNLPQEIIDVYADLKKFMLAQIECNAYAIVDLSKVFSSYTNELINGDDLMNDLI